MWQYSLFTNYGTKLTVQNSQIFIVLMRKIWPSPNRKGEESIIELMFKMSGKDTIDLLLNCVQRVWRWTKKTMLAKIKRIKKTNDESFLFWTLWTIIRVAGSEADCYSSFFMYLVE